MRHRPDHFHFKMEEQGRKSMNQKQLEIFTALADNLNFTKTAEQLYLSQTTVTLQIRSLEEELQVKLFERTSRSVRLTYAGSVFLNGAREILDKIQLTVSETVFAAQGYTGQLRIGFADDVNAAGLSKLLRDYSACNPQIHLLIQGGYPEDLLERLLSDEFDLIFTPAFRSLRNENLVRHVMGRYRTVAAFHQDHRFSRKKSLKYTDFEGENYIFISGKQEELDFSGDFVHQLNTRHIHINHIARMDNIDTVFLMLDADLGITVLPEYFIGRFAGTSQICTCPIEEGLKPTAFLAVWKDKGMTSPLKQFVKTLQNDRSLIPN